MTTDTTTPCASRSPELGRMGPAVAAALDGARDPFEGVTLYCALPAGHRSRLHEWKRADYYAPDDLPNLLAVSWDPTGIRGAALFADREPASWALDGDPKWFDLRTPPDVDAEPETVEHEAVEHVFVEGELVDPEPYIVASLLVRLRSVGEVEVTVRYPEPDGDELQNLAARCAVDDVARGVRAVLRGEARP